MTIPSSTYPVLEGQAAYEWDLQSAVEEALQDSMECRDYTAGAQYVIERLRKDGYLVAPSETLKQQLVASTLLEALKLATSYVQSNTGGRANLRENSYEVLRIARAAIGLAERQP